MMRRRKRPVLGTFVEIAAAGSGDAAIDDAFRAIEAMQRVASFQDADSDLTRLNRAGGEDLEVHPLLMRVLRLARGFAVASGETFNPTVGGALVRRGILPDHGGGTVPDCGGARDIELRGRRVRLRRGVRLTLDGIAKGFAVDLAIVRLRRGGAAAGYVNAGGDMRCFGDVVVPVLQREADGAAVPLGGLRNAAIATSRVAPAYDPDTPGIIITSGQRAVAPIAISILAERCWRADALTKVAALANPRERAAAVERLGGRWIEPATGQRANGLAA